MKNRDFDESFIRYIRSLSVANRLLRHPLMGGTVDRIWLNVLFNGYSMFGLYVSRRSPIHSLSVRAKLLTLAVVGVVVLWVGEPIVLAGLLGIISLLPVLAKLPLRSVWLQVRPIVPLLLAVGLIQGIWGDWATGLVALLRFLILILLATIVSLTTRVSDLVEAIEQALQPGKRFGINPAQISLMLALAIRLIPTLLNQFHQIQEAQRARGLDRNWLALFVPFLIKTLRMADELSDALDARGYDADVPTDGSG